MRNTTLSLSELQIRALTADDWDAVSSIYRDGIATGQATFETETPTWTDWSENHLAAPRLVATSGAHVVGWAALGPCSSRAIYAGVAETSVYVADDWQGKGVGRALLKTLVADAERNGIWTLQASIFPENAASLQLHRSCGFRVVGTRARIGKMNNIWRDTLLLERRSNLVGSD